MAAFVVFLAVQWAAQQKVTFDALKAAHASDP